MKYKEMQKRKSGKDSNGARTCGKSDQVRVIKEADEDSCDALTAQEKVNTQMLKRLAGHEYYHFLDSYSGYNQIPIAP